MASTARERADDRAMRETAPVTKADLWNWIYSYTGVRIARESVWPGHQAPFDSVVAQYPGPLRDRPEGPPPLSLTLGSRGSGKSFTAAVVMHAGSRFYPRYETRILGGSKDQSRQIYDGIDKAVIAGKGPLGNDAGSIKKLLDSTATYHNRSKVKILAASDKSVRGPHVPNLKLDEVDEILPKWREDAMGMCMEMHGYDPIVSMCSTWHRLGGPMAGLIDDAKAGKFPLYAYNAFDVLTRCPESRSGPRVDGDAMYRDCPACPIVAWCHSHLIESSATGRVEPMAKRADGHYSIKSLIQKTLTNSARTFASDYLCLGPRADGIWFRQYDALIHCTPATDRLAEYDPSLPVHLAVDTGVHTGAVWFQVRHPDDPIRSFVTVFADYYSEGLTAEQNARAILSVTLARCGGRVDFATTDPAGNSRNPVGPTVLAIYAAVGLNLGEWPTYSGSVRDGLSLVESFVMNAVGKSSILIHTRCIDTHNAFQGYRRKAVRGSWTDHPEDPQHPFEDLLDALRGGLIAVFPNGRISGDSTAILGGGEHSPLDFRPDGQGYDDARGGLVY